MSSRVRARRDSLLESAMVAVVWLPLRFFGYTHTSHLDLIQMLYSLILELRIFTEENYFRSGFLCRFCPSPVSFHHKHNLNRREDAPPVRCCCRRAAYCPPSWANGAPVPCIFSPTIAIRSSAGVWSNRCPTAPPTPAASIAGHWCQGCSRSRLAEEIPGGTRRTAPAG